MIGALAGALSLGKVVELLMTGTPVWVREVAAPGVEAVFDLGGADIIPRAVLVAG